jgi:hypothetical protein
MSVTDKVVIEAINRKLKERGRSLDGRPILRLVFSDDQIEKRVGTFTDWYGHILIRQEYKALRETKKYGYIKGKWILERLTYLNPENKIVQEELVEARNGSYEPLYVFQDKDSNPLPVNWQVIERLLWTMENYSPTRGNEHSVDSEEAEEMAKEIAYFEEVLGETGRSQLFAAEAAEFQDSTKQKYWERKDEPAGAGSVSGSEGAAPSAP